MEKQLYDSEITFEMAPLGPVRIHYAKYGSGDRLIILLHGFPEFWYGWRHQLKIFGKGYTVVAPDMRGYNLSDKPLEKEAYRMEHLVDDVMGLIKYFGKEKAILVGHDWGAAVAWNAAAKHPEAIDKLCAMQVPPNAALKANMSFRQMCRSWYMLFFQMPIIPEKLVHSNLKKLLRGSCIRKQAFSNEDLALYQQAVEQPGALKAMMNYYRANFSSFFHKGKGKQGKIRVPTLFIFGENDHIFLPQTVKGIGRFIEAPFQEVFIPDCGHWVQNEAFEEVNQALLKFIEET